MAGQKIVKSKFFFEDDFLESLAEVPAKEIGAWEPGKKLKIVGTPVSRVDGYDKVSGTAQYTFDVSLPNMAFAKTLRCPHPHARIKSIDISKAQKLPGVLAIITHKNTPAIPWYYNTSYLFDSHLRYLGDEVACAAAESEEIAAEALKLIIVEYEILPFVTDAKKAMEPNAPKLYKEGNIRGGKPFVYKRGDAEKGFKEADAVVEDTFTTQVAVHNPTEVHCSAANWDGDQLTVWDSTQSIFSVRDALAQSLKIPASKVRVIKKYMGGGFGCKLAPGKYTVMAAILARKIGRPVKIALDRKEMNLAVGNRPNSVQKLKAGAKKDGTLTALSHHAYGTVGSHTYSAGCSWPLRTVYQCDNVYVEEYSVYTNAGPARPMRAPGHVQGTFGMDSLIDELAEKIGMDPLEFRLKNYAEKDQVYNIPYTSKRLREAYKKGADAIGWHRRSQPAGSGTGPMKRGIGMATQIWWGGGGPPALATIKLNRDGSANVMAGTQDIGTGTYTYLAQVTTEVLEIPLEKITVTLGDTRLCPYCPGSGGSVTTPSVAPAVHDAAEQIKAKLISGAAALLELPEGQLLYEKGVISDKKDPSKKIAITDILRKMQEQELIATGARNANPKGYTINTFGAQFAEVEVDTETGKVKVLKVVAAHDIGRVLNWKTAENQFHGGIIQGISFALMEQRIIDQTTGKVLTTNMHDYKMPTVMDMPEIEAYVVSDADTLISSVGAKGLGEPAHIPTAGAIANAVYNAIGVRIKSLPITPDKVLTALQKARRVS
jgi:xanthine dehydrogenase YagR molybdenum-binding subunit